MDSSKTKYGIAHPIDNQDNNSCIGRDKTKYMDNWYMVSYVEGNLDDEDSLESIKSKLIKFRKKWLVYWFLFQLPINKN